MLKISLFCSPRQVPVKAIATAYSFVNTTATSITTVTTSTAFNAFARACKSRACEVMRDGISIVRKPQIQIFGEIELDLLRSLF